jgi:hypothetical protein
VNIYFTIIDGGSQYQGASAIACSKKKTKKEGYWQYIQLNNLMFLYFKSIFKKN